MKVSGLVSNRKPNVSVPSSQWRRFVFRAGCPPAHRGWGMGRGLYPSPENFEILFLKMVHFGAFLYALNKV